MSSFRNVSSDVLNNSSDSGSLTSVIMQMIDDGLKNDIHNSMILSSTVLAVVAVGFLVKGYSMYTNYRKTLSNPPASSASFASSDSLTNVVGVNSP
jgi:hypothetical protein